LINDPALGTSGLPKPDTKSALALVQTVDQAARLIWPFSKVPEVLFRAGLWYVTIHRPIHFSVARPVPNSVATPIPLGTQRLGLFRPLIFMRVGIAEVLNAEVSCLPTVNLDIESPVSDQMTRGPVISPDVGQ
jgi:hypothetical protein